MLTCQLFSAGFFFLQSSFWWKWSTFCRTIRAHNKLNPPFTKWRKIFGQQKSTAKFFQQFHTVTKNMWSLCKVSAKLPMWRRLSVIKNCGVADLDLLVKGAVATQNGLSERWNLKNFLDITRSGIRGVLKDFTFTVFMSVSQLSMNCSCCLLFFLRYWDCQLPETCS